MVGMANSLSLSDMRGHSLLYKFKWQVSVMQNSGETVVKVRVMLELSHKGNNYKLASKRYNSVMNFIDIYSRRHKTVTFLSRPVPFK